MHNSHTRWCKSDSIDISGVAHQVSKVGHNRILLTVKFDLPNLHTSGICDFCTKVQALLQHSILTALLTSHSCSTKQDVYVNTNRIFNTTYCTLAKLGRGRTLTSLSPPPVAKTPEE